MAISKITFELVIELFNRGLFKGKKSILDMGDQDINLKFNEIESLINQTNKEFQKDLFLSAKNYPERPRVQSSMLWKNFLQKTSFWKTATPINLLPKWVRNV